jgi:hypothetical protein
MRYAVALLFCLALAACSAAHWMPDNPAQERYEKPDTGGGGGGGM